MAKLSALRVSAPQVGHIVRPEGISLSGWHFAFVITKPSNHNGFLKQTKKHTMVDKKKRKIMGEIKELIKKIGSIFGSGAHLA